MVEHAPDFVKQYLPQILQRLMALIGAEDARDEENASATDNAVSVLGKILEKFPNQGANAASLWPVWLNYLPLKDDEIEAKIVHAQLVRLVKARNPNLMASNVLPRVRLFFFARTCTSMRGSQH